mgnify:CR=1 FL=1
MNGITKFTDRRHYPFTLDCYYFFALNALFLVLGLLSCSMISSWALAQSIFSWSSPLGILTFFSITFLLISNGLADSYPSKPIKLIVPYGAGGGGDTTSRFIADLATDILGVKVLIKGRIKGKPRSNTVSIVKGLTPIQSISKNIEYSKLNVYTLNGAFGFKLWVYR